MNSNASVMRSALLPLEKKRAYLFFNEIILEFNRPFEVAFGTESVMFCNALTIGLFWSPFCFISYCNVSRETGSKFFHQKSPIVKCDTTPTQCQSQTGP